METDNVTAERTISLVVSCLSEATKPTSSPPTVIEGIPWCLVAVNQELTSNSQGEKPRTLGIFLKCTYDSPEQVWSVTAHVTIKLVNHANPEKSYSKDFHHDFSQESSDWGYSSFMKWKDVVDPVKGFVMDDSLTIVSHIEVKCINEVEVTQKQSLSSVLSCPLCHNEFQVRGKMLPLSLICGHSFCVDCLQKGCTQCESGIVKISCSLCKKENSSTTEHNLWFPNHAMVQVISAGVVLKSNNLCDTHQHEKSYYCFDDGILVCIYCAYDGDHCQHKCQRVDAAKQQIDHELQEYKQQIISSLSQLEQDIFLRTDERKLLQLQQSGIVKAVRDFYTELSSLLMKHQESLLDELSTQTRNMDTVIERSIKSLTDECHDIKLALQEYSAWQNLSPQEALSKTNIMRDRLRSASVAKSPVCNVPKLPKITLEMPSLNVLSSLQHLGRLKVESSELQTTSSEGVATALHGSLVDGTEFPAKKRREA